MSSILVQVIVGGLLLGAVYALFSSGLTLIWGMMNIVNFAHGDFVMLGMYVAFVVWTVLGVGPFVGAPAAALVLATLGIIVYFGLIRSVMKGPMLAQILGTFGLALLLRYSVFWGFGANFLTLPGDLVGGTYDVLGIKLQASRLLAGVVALLVTLGLHLLLTRTSLGSKMLAVAEDATAAQLMGIRPDSMQAIAWAIAAGATGLAGALIATFFYIAPTVGETLGIVAFVTVSLGGFGSVPGALVAGLLIGVIEFRIGLLDWRGLQGHRGVFAVPVFPLVPAAGPDGQDVMRRFIWPTVALALVILYPLVFTTPFQQRLGALILLYAIAASAWNIIGGYAGQVSVGHVVFFGCGAYASMAAYSHFGLPPLVGNPRRYRRRGSDCGGDRRADAAPVRPLFQHGDDRGCRARALDRHQHGSSRCRGRPQRPDRAAHGVRSLLHLGIALLLFVPERSRRHPRHHTVDDEQPDGILSARHQGFPSVPRARLARLRAAPSFMRLCSALASPASPARSIR